MSNYLIHLTKGESGNDGYDSIMGIYGSCALKATNRFGIGKDKSPNPKTQRVVCFSEIPPGQWNRLEAQRGTKYGIAFTKEFVMSRGGAPIWYAWKDTAHWRTLQAMMAVAAEDPEDPIWKLTPMIDAPGSYGRSQYFFDWEREWRHIGSMQFEPNDVAFLLIPEHNHVAARGFFENAFNENLGPAFLCPYVDPSWPRNRILAELNS